jgi:hypothetical protein
VNETNPSAPGVLGMTGAFVIAALAGGGACCASCFGGLFVLDGIFLGGGGALVICGIVGLATFGGVLSVLTRTVDALKSQESLNTDGVITPQANSREKDGTDDTRQ